MDRRRLPLRGPGRSSASSRSVVLRSFVDSRVRLFSNRRSAAGMMRSSPSPVAADTAMMGGCWRLLRRTRPRRSVRSGCARSHLFSTRRVAQWFWAAWSHAARSASVMPSVASATTMATSERAAASRARIWLYCSTRSRMRPRRRRPAVSMSTISRPSQSMMVSTGSRVVPGRSCTIMRSSPRSALRIELLPTFGRPMMQKAGSRSSESSSSTSSISGRLSTSRSRKSPMPRPCSADTVTTSPRPRPQRSWARISASALSHLLATTITGRFERLRRSATSMSPAVAPAAASTTNRMRSASSMARMAWLAMSFAIIDSSASSMPPVSRIWN